VTRRMWYSGSLKITIMVWWQVYQAVVVKFFLGLTVCLRRSLLLACEGRSIALSTTLGMTGGDRHTGRKPPTILQALNLVAPLATQGSTPAALLSTLHPMGSGKLTCDSLDNSPPSEPSGLSVVLSPAGGP
jgi:hypothetical protein